VGLPKQEISMSTLKHQDQGTIKLSQMDYSVGHRTLRVEEYGKVAATFVDIKTSRAVRVAPRLDIRERASDFVLEESRHYFAQMQAYQVMPDEDMLTVKDVNFIYLSLELGKTVR
jgi:formylmethanofuran dehydrogenase subunit E